MAGNDAKDVEAFVKGVEARAGGETEFLQAVHEVAQHIVPFLRNEKELRSAKVFERMCEPDRVIMFRVCWVDDKGEMQMNRGYRVQFNGAVGPYKGGLRFHPTVNLSVLKFLGFEQIFKNSLTGLPIGGGKGGSDFNPKGKSDNEVMRFCHAFMGELFRHIGDDVDVPAGDIGVGGRELGYMAGQYRRLTNRFHGALTGKGLPFGGSLLRPEATGYGLVYYTDESLKAKDEGLRDKVCAVSGSGNVAQYCVEKLLQNGAKVVTMSDSGGAIYDPDGIDEEKLKFVMDLKNERRGRISEYVEKFSRASYAEGKRPWGLPDKIDLAFPCATQNEIEKADAEDLVKACCCAVMEGANMPSTAEAVDIFAAKGISYGPAKAANAGGVACSTFEMSQNAGHTRWSREKVDDELQATMRKIYQQCVDYGGKDLAKGANIAGFKRVADAMLAYGDF